MNFRPTPTKLETADILLINPDFSKNELGVSSAPENHLGLNRLASYLVAKRHAVQVIDTTGRPASQRGPEELGDWLVGHTDRYKIIGFHCNSWNINHILRTLDRARQKLKDKKLLFGGPLPNSEPLRMMQLFINKGMDNIGVVQGMGEKITDEILSRHKLLVSDAARDKLLGIEGLWAFEKGKFQPGCKVAVTSEEFEKFPYLSLEHNTFYQHYWRPVIESGDLGEYSMDVIFASQGLDVNRGCQFKCTYCSVPQYEEKVIQFSPKRVADELEYLAREAGFFMFTFTNSNIMFYSRDWIEEFCHEIIGRGMSEYLNWTAYHHPSIIAPLPISVYNLMCKAGCETIVFGVQSFEEKICRLFMRPPNTCELTEIIRDKCRQAKLQLAVDYITGVPGENLDIIEKAFDYFIKNNIECRNYQLKFYPNTRLPVMGLDLSDHELVPITGNLAPELEAYAVVPKKPNPYGAQLDGRIRQHNADVVSHRPVRIGKYYIKSQEQVCGLVANDIPKNPHIPDKVKRSMTIALNEMLNPRKRQTGFADLSPKEMMKVIVMAGPDSPPMVLAMQAKLRDELGLEKFEKLRVEYKDAKF